MKENVVNVSLGRDSYKIHIGEGLLEESAELIRPFCPNDKVAIVTNQTIDELYSSKLCSSLEAAGITFNILTVGDGEQFKSLETASILYDLLIESKMSRYDPIIVLGGGVVGDLGGFAAATFMRGLPFIQIPTTLLAQVDSSVGGKVAVNHPKAKNFIGCFYQPKLVITDVTTLKTLPERELKAGLAEAIKCGFLDGEVFLSYLESHMSDALNLDMDKLVQIVVRCCQMKAGVVEKDEKDQGLRAILNYGHTIGHAIEAVSEYKQYLHGEAIAVGMICAAEIANRMDFIPAELVKRHQRIIKETGLPTRIKDVDMKAIVERIELDKKACGEANNFVLLKGVGKPVLTDVSLDIVKDILKRVISD